ncbi:hypothetical protein AWV80_05795 [Cupriavidus sp. UYMU48A]|nr:hypothetical protein AWV80_05795 [Cupriavidus sp. UYMU48A]
MDVAGAAGRVRDCLMILMASRYSGLSWWIGVPGAIAVTIAGVFLDHAIERKHAQSQIRN